MGARPLPVHPLAARDSRGERPGVPGARHGRIAHLDRLKYALVATIIAVHAAFGYSSLEGTWPYAPVREMSLSPAAETALGIVAVPGATFALGLLFLVAGLLTPGSVDRKGPRRFAYDRLLRLGVPLIAWIVVVWPAATAATRQATGRAASWWEELTRSQPPLDAGPMWFVEVLLVFSLAYAGFRALAGRRAAGGSDACRPPAVGRHRRLLGARRPAARLPRPVGGRTLAGLAVAVSLTTMAVRLELPFASGQVGQSHLWQWPQYVALFGLGIVAARRGGLDPVPDGVFRAAGLGAAAALCAFAGLVAAVLATGADRYVFFEARAHWAPLGLAALEGPLSVGASVWLLGFAQRHLDRPLRLLERGLASDAYAAYIVQTPVLLALAVALRPAAAPAEVKALAVGVAGIFVSFGLARLLRGLWAPRRSGAAA